MGALSAVPLPIRILGVALIAFLVVRLLSGIGSILLIAAVLLWALVTITLLYESGHLRWAEGMAPLDRLLRWLTNRAAAAAHDDGAPATRRLSDAERRKAEAEGWAALDTLVGADAAVDQIATRILGPARRAVEEGARDYGGRAPALAVIVAGPRGVGKSDMARALVDLLAGAGALADRATTLLRARDLREGGHSGPAALGEAMAEKAVGGGLIMDDADWLVAPDAYDPSARGPGVDVGLGVLEAARRAPRSFVLVMTMAPESEQRLRADAEHRRWLGVMGTHTVTLDHLDPDALLALVARALEAQGRALDEDAERAARSMLRDYRDRLGDGFDNALACERVARRLIDAADDPDIAAASDGRTITRAHVRHVADTID